MKILYEDNIVIYINDKIELNDINDIKVYLKNLFIKIKDRINISGFYDSFIYKDKRYGMIIELIKDDSDYFDYLDEIDMHITLEDTVFLYQINDIFIDNKIINNNSIYLYDNKYYLKLNNKLNDIDFSKLLEVSELVYKDTNIILNCGKKIKYML